METVLIVDDEKNYPLILSAVLEEEGYETLTSHTGPHALQQLAEADVDLVLTDMKMPEMDGISLLGAIKKRQPDLPVIMMTAHGTVEKAVEAMQKGAYTYILKPFDNESLVQHVKNAIAMFRVVKENKRLRDMVADRFAFGNLVGKSGPMQAIYATIRKVAPSSASILIEGESGTGKELVARALHFNSLRKDRAFIAVNCAALAESLLESELFGHEKGAFTGAATMKKGRFELADGGTLLLDEIGELSANLQVKLLRVLQEKTIERVGGSRAIPVDFRLVAATNKSLREEVGAGRFREDLYYRLNVVHLELPPLRERGGDISLLADHFLRKYAGERGDAEVLSGFSPECQRLLLNYPWPGNVRELENVVERAVILASGPTISPHDLPRDFQQNAHNTDPLASIDMDIPLSKALSRLERQLIERALHTCNNVQTRAAAKLGITKSGLNQKIKKYGIRVGSKN